MNIFSANLNFLSEECQETHMELERLINQIFRNPILNKKINMIHKFFEVSMMNFINGEESIIKQLMICKKSGKKKKKSIFRKLMRMFDPFLERWFVITSEGIGYMTHNRADNKSFREYNFYP